MDTSKYVSSHLPSLVCPTLYANKRVHHFFSQRPNVLFVVSTTMTDRSMCLHVSAREIETLSDSMCRSQRHTLCEVTHSKKMWMSVLIMWSWSQINQCMGNIGKCKNIFCLHYESVEGRGTSAVVGGPPKLTRTHLCSHSEENEKRSQCILCAFTPEQGQGQRLHSHYVFVSKWHFQTERSPSRWELCIRMNPLTHLKTYIT